MLASLLDQDPPHRLGRGREEVPAAIPALGVIGAHEPQIGFVNEPGRLQSLTRLLVRHVSGREPAQFRIDEREQFGSRLRVAGFNRR